MGTQEVIGRVPAEPGSREPSPAVSALAGFDPSRVLAQMDDYLDAAEAVGAIPKHFRMAESLLSDLSNGGARLASYRSVPIVCATEWSWGWMLLVHESLFRWKEHWFNPKDHAQQVSETPSDTLGEKA